MIIYYIKEKLYLIKTYLVIFTLQSILSFTHYQPKIQSATIFKKTVALFLFLTYNTNAVAFVAGS